MEEPFVDWEDEPDPELNRVSNAIIGACIEAHRHLGPGYLEAYYEEALEREFKLRSIRYVRQCRFSVLYKDEPIGTGCLDFLVEDAVILELKSIEQFAPVHTAKMISYLRATRKKLGLLVNFNVRLLKEGIKRIAL
jgi:GxxExxY protein